MRITNKMLSDSFLTDMQVNLNNLKKIQEQTASAKNFSKPSDDPFNVVRAMQLHTEINANTQYKTNIVNSLNFMNTTDTALNQIGNVLTDIRENLIKAGNAAYGSDERGKIKDEINQRISQIAQLLNTNFQGDYIFGGTRGLTKPVMTEEYSIEDPQVGTNFSSSNPFDASKWNGKTIIFSVANSSGSTNETIKLENSNTSIDDVIDDLNHKIQANSKLVDKITVTKTADGNMRFTSNDGGDDIRIKGTSVTDLYSFKENLNGKAIDFNAEEWKGTVNINFNVNGTDVPVSIDCSTVTDITSANTALTTAISSKSQLSGLNVTNDGTKLQFGVTSGEDIKITSASTLSLSALEGRKFSTESLDDGNISIKYLGADGKSIEDISAVETSSIDLGNWKGKSITFSINGVSDDTTQIEPPTGPNTSTKIVLPTSIDNIDDLVKDINTQIQKNPNLTDKITAVKTDDGNIKFLAVNSRDNINISNTTVTHDLDSLKGIQLSSVEMDNVSSKRKAEVSQGVVVEYNACATDILQYGLTSDDNTAALLDRIVHHLAGQIESYTKADGTAYTASDPGAAKDGEGKYYIWVDDEEAGTAALTSQDLSDIDEASKQLIKVRSEIGSKANRMESMSDQNDDTKINMTEILSKTEDIDITEKTIEYYTMITVYQASLQTSARVMQPTLMDYIS